MPGFHLINEVFVGVTEIDFSPWGKQQDICTASVECWVIYYVIYCVASVKHTECLHMVATEECPRFLFCEPYSTCFFSSATRFLIYMSCKNTNIITWCFSFNNVIF